VPTLRGTVVPGELLVAASSLTVAGPEGPPPTVEVTGDQVTIGWPDGAQTACQWTAEVPAVSTRRSGS
jgi:hypothetical protein